MQYCPRLMDDDEDGVEVELMQYCPRLMDDDEDVVVVMEEIPNTMILIVIIYQNLKKRKLHCTTRSRIILR